MNIDNRKELVDFDIPNHFSRGKVLQRNFWKKFPSKVLFNFGERRTFSNMLLFYTSEKVIENPTTLIRDDSNPDPKHLNAQLVYLKDPQHNFDQR